MILHAGIATNVTEPSIAANPLCRQLLGARYGDYFSIHCQRRSTEVVRCLKPIRTASQTRADYVYLDVQTFHLLQAEIGDALLVKPSDVTFDVP